MNSGYPTYNSRILPIWKSKIHVLWALCSTQVVSCVCVCIHVSKMVVEKMASSLCKLLKNHSDFEDLGKF